MARINFTMVELVGKLFGEGNANDMSVILVARIKFAMVE